ncbi:Mpp10 protein-domain-containing protein, partial [Russula earlei]
MSPTDDFEASLPTPFRQLSLLLETQPETLITGNKEIQDASLRSTEHVFNVALSSEEEARPHISSLLASFSPRQAPVTRSQSSMNKKRKRSPSPPPAPKDAFERTPLTCLYVQGLEKDQIWEQLELRAQNVCKMLEYALGGIEDPTENAIASDDDDLEQKHMKKAGGSSDGGLSEEAITALQDRSVEDDEEGLDGESRPPPPVPFSTTRGDHPGLNDGFFDLEAFNAETEEAEASFVSNGALDADSDDMVSDEDSIDYFTSVDGQLHVDDDREPRYSDFFDMPTSVGEKKTGPRLPGAEARSKVRFNDEVKIRTVQARGKRLPVSIMHELDDASDDSTDDSFEPESEDESDDDQPATMEAVDLGGDESPEGENATNDDHRTIKRLQADLFANDDEPDHGLLLSSHEKRLSALQQQIAALEAENVAKKDWTLMGEATSRTRPHNSLLEEDLEFGRVMKAVPIITEEIVSGLEDRIKARIVEGRFDDVVRKRPVDDKPFLPSRFFELQDTKSKQSLAQIYEDQYTAAQTGGIEGEDRDGKLKVEHEEITKGMGGDLLETGCPIQYPISLQRLLESALPTSNAVASMMAPEEIYERPSADPRSRAELSPKERRAARNKLKKARKKTTQKSAAFRGTIKGVTVVGKPTRKKGSSGSGSGRTPR